MPSSSTIVTQRRRHERHRLHKLIVEYLDAKFRQPDGPNFPFEKYATAREIFEWLGGEYRLAHVCRAMGILHARGKIRRYPELRPNTRMRKYGSLQLPPLTLEDRLGDLEAVLGPVFSERIRAARVND